MRIALSSLAAVAAIALRCLASASSVDAGDAPPTVVEDAAVLSKGRISAQQRALTRLTVATKGR